VRVQAGPLLSLEQGVRKCALFARAALVYGTVADISQSKLKKTQFEIFRLKFPAITHFLNSVW
jgi:hypothetical protein